MLSNMRRLIKKHLPVWHSDSDLKEILPPSLCTKNKNEKKSYITKTKESVTLVKII